MKSNDELKQGSKEWHTFRSLGLGASDAPAVMGCSPWTSRFELWAHKTKLMEPSEPHPFAVAAMKRGTELEPVARQKYIERTGIVIEPVTLVHPEYDFIRASLDGFNAEVGKLVEIKCPGKADLALARKGKIPEKYRWQLVQQCLLTNPKSVDYVVYDGKDELIVIPFQPADADLELLLAESIKFWALVTENVPPEVTDDDFDKVVAKVEADSARLTKTLATFKLVNDVRRGQAAS